MRRDSARCSLGMLFVLFLAAFAVAQETPARPEDSPWQELYRTEAGAYRFRVTAPEPHDLQWQPQPVMQWISLNDFKGDVFVWTDQGRPEVVGTIFSFPTRTDGHRNVMHEFHSLSELPVRANGPGDVAFAFKPRADLKPIPGAPVPADQPARLQLQSRALARQFSASMMRQGERWELRLLNQPLYRYEKADNGVLGGALFAFVGYVTDPEILLLVEARQTSTGPAWHYVAARFSDKSLWLSHRGAEVWQYQADPAADSAEPYYLAPAKVMSIPAGR